MNTTALTVGCPTGGSTAGGLSCTLLHFTAWCSLALFEASKGLNCILTRWSWSCPHSMGLHLGRLDALKNRAYLHNAPDSPWLSDNKGICWTNGTQTTLCVCLTSLSSCQHGDECCSRLKFVLTFSHRLEMALTDIVERFLGHYI